MISKIGWENFEGALPAFLTITSMTFTFSISKGIGFGFISYCIIKLAVGKWREVHPLMWVISLVFVIYSYLSQICCKSKKIIFIFPNAHL
jgi:AGZA family xanthine/uracil permease-like MFS transporter